VRLADTAGAGPAGLDSPRPSRTVCTMDKRRRRARSDENELPPLVETEWLGGCYPIPDIVTAEHEDVPNIMLWLDRDGDRLVQVMVPAAEFPTPFAFSLVRAMFEPGAGFPRRPRRIRVADAALEEELAGGDLDAEIVVAPTPELDDAFAELCVAMRGESDPECSYFEDGAIGEAAVAAIFAAAADLYRIAPWNELVEFQVLEVDIEALGIQGACLSVTGALDEEEAQDAKGLMLFRSFEDHERYMDALASMDLDDTQLDFNIPVLALTYHRREELPQQMRRETASHGWPVAAASAYPFLEYRNRYGVPEALREDDARVIAACARGLSEFLREHLDELPLHSEKVVEGTYPAGADVAIRIAAHGGDWMFDLPPPMAPVVHGHKIGRNEPCPCGSGKKYKKCCMARDEAARRRGGD